MPKPIIKELWMLWNPESKDFALAADDPDPYDAYLCTKSFEAAVALQKHQKEMYEVTSIPLQVK